MVDENAEAQRAVLATITPMHRPGWSVAQGWSVCSGGLAPPPWSTADTPSGRLLLSLLVVLLKLLKTEGLEGHVSSPSPPLWAGCPELGSAEGQQRKWKDKIPTPPLPRWDRPKLCSGCQVLAPHFTEGLPEALALAPEQRGWRGQLVGWRGWVSNVQAPDLGPLSCKVKEHVGLGPNALIFSWRQRRERGWEEQSLSDRGLIPEAEQLPACSSNESSLSPALTWFLLTGFPEPAIEDSPWSKPQIPLPVCPPASFILFQLRGSTCLGIGEESNHFEVFTKCILPHLQLG